MEKVCVCVLWRRVRTWLAAHVIVKPRRLRRPQITCTAIRSSTPHSHTHAHTYTRMFHHVLISDHLSKIQKQDTHQQGEENPYEHEYIRDRQTDSTYTGTDPTDRLTGQTYRHRPDRQTNRQFSFLDLYLFFYFFNTNHQKLGRPFPLRSRLRLSQQRLER